MEPFPTGGVFGEREEKSTRRKRGTPLSPAAVERDRRMAVVAGAVSLGLFVLALFVLTTTVYAGNEVCGSPFGRVGGRSESCDNALSGRIIWALLLGFGSLAMAAQAFVLRWWRGWWKT
jgi:hypothetical protein